MSKYGCYLNMSQQQKDIVAIVKEFAERELDPLVVECDRSI